MNDIENLAEYLASERLQLCKAISEHKWYLSEQAGYDVGYQFAEQNFIENILPTFANDFRARYCNNCPEQTQHGILCHAELLKAS